MAQRRGRDASTRRSQVLYLPRDNVCNSYPQCTIRSISRVKYSTLCLIVLLWKIKHNSTLSSCMASCNSMYYPCWEQPTSSISNSISCFSIYNRQKYHSIFIASDSRSTGLGIPGSPLPFLCPHEGWETEVRISIVSTKIMSAINQHFNCRSVI